MMMMNKKNIQDKVRILDFLCLTVLRLLPHNTYSLKGEIQTEKSDLDKLLHVGFTLMFLIEDGKKKNLERKIKFY